MTMYLTHQERTGVLVELIVKMLKLVGEGKISETSAFHSIVEQAKEHPDWPEAETAVPPPITPPMAIYSQPTPEPPVTIERAEADSIPAF